MKITSGQVMVLIHQLAEVAKAKGWTLVKKPGGSIPVHKCPKCGKVSVITFFKDCTNGMEFFDTCIHNKTKGENHCNMICQIFVRHDKWNVPKYRQFCTATFVPYGAAVAPDGINVLKYR